MIAAESGTVCSSRRDRRLKIEDLRRKLGIGGRVAISGITKITEITE